MPRKTDILVIGSGIAGLTFALKSAQALPSNRITLVTKGQLSESNTRFAQGGMAVVTGSGHDDRKKHIDDTLQAGDGLCDPGIVEIVVNEAADRLEELIHWGAAFDKDADGAFHLGKEGGHSLNRIVHKGDSTGMEIEKTLVAAVRKQKNIRILQHHFAIDLITGEAAGKPERNKTCYGALIADTRNNKIFTIFSRVTLMAAGGIGQIYPNTTNPAIATGDAIAMAYRAGADIRNMEFIQFHPTALHSHEEEKSFLISEAVRGAGALLRTISGERFMHRYHEKQELACRDIVSRAIKNEMRRNHSGHVLLDCRHIPLKQFRKEFPTIYRKCTGLGIDITKNMIPVSPSAHYTCGGIVTDENGSTSIEHLYACGECACTGLHGANRLASNSLPEALVFAHRASQKMLKIVNTIQLPAFPVPKPEFTGVSEEYLEQSKYLLQRKMSDIAIECSDETLSNTWQHIRKLYQEISHINKKGFNKNAFELMNMLDVACLVVSSSLQRKENRGSFYKKEAGQKEKKYKNDFNLHKV
jgi:L-aspartate oxidase